jgi:hypothetical protein
VVDPVNENVLIVVGSPGAMFIVDTVIVKSFAGVVPPIADPKIFN